jgi:hypothetical protein
MRLRRSLFVLAAAAALAPTVSTPDALIEGFQNPPMSARPQVWWHWLGGNVTAEGAASISSG